MLQFSLVNGPTLGVVPKGRLVQTEAEGVKREMSQPIVTICDVTGEWVWTGAKVMETVGGPSYEGAWRKRAADEACGDFRFMAEEMVAVGPMLIPGTASSFAFQWNTLLPEDWRIAINETITHGDSDDMRPAIEGKIWGRLRDFLGPEMPASINKDFVSFDRENIMTREWVTENAKAINAGFISIGKSWAGTYEDFVTRGLWEADLVDTFIAPRPKNPVLLTKHPKTGKEYGLFFSIVRADLTKPWDSTTNPWVLQIVWRPIYKHWYSKFWEWIKNIVSKLINFVKDTWCALSADPAVTAGTMATGNPYAMGAAIGSSILAPLVCKPKTQTCFDGTVIPVAATCPEIPDAGPKTSKWKWPLIVAGGLTAIGLVAFLLKPKPRKKQLPAAA
jgi:hypothetical protein